MFGTTYSTVCDSLLVLHFSSHSLGDLFLLLRVREHSTSVFCRQPRPPSRDYRVLPKEQSYMCIQDGMNLRVPLSGPWAFNVVGSCVR